MENISTLSDKFSWRRMASVGLLYMKPMKLYFIVSALISAVGYLIMQWLVHNGIEPLPLYTFISMIVGAALYLSPLSFTRCDDGLIAMLPVKASEKWVFYMIYVLVLAPIAVQGTWYLLNFIFTLINEDNNLTYLMYEAAHFDLDKIPVGNRVFFFSISIIQSVAIMVTVLLIVLSSKSHRVVKAVLGFIGVIFGSSILAGLAGFAIAIANIPEFSKNNDPSIIAVKMLPAFKVIYGIILCYAIYIMWYIYRWLAKGQVKA